MKTTNAIFILIVLILTGSIIWINVTEIEEIIRAEGEVEPESQVQVIQPRFTAKIVSLNVSVGDEVRKGETVAQLSKLEEESQLQENLSTIDVLIAEISRLKAEVNNDDKIAWSFIVPDELKKVQEALFFVRKEKLDQEEDVLIQEEKLAQNRVVEIDQRISGIRKLLDFKIIEKELYEPLVKNGVEPKTKLIEIESEIQRFENELLSNKANLTSTNIELDKTQSRRQELFKNFKARAFEDLAKKQNQLRLTRTKTEALKERLNQTELKSPIDGIITKVYPKGVGEIATGGKELIEVAPFFSNVRVKAKLKPQDVTNLKEGQRSRIILSSYDFTVYGTISGYVDEIAQNTSETDRGEIFYEIWVESKNLKLSKSDVEPTILPGMLTQIEIVGKKRTIFEYLMKPILESTSRAFTEK